MTELTFVGAVTRDRVRGPQSWIVGGAVVYAGAAADALGARVRVVTAHGDDFQRPEWTRHWEWLRQLSQATTAFENLDVGAERRQRLWARCTPMDHSRLAPESWQPAGWLVLAPVFDELPLERWLRWAAGASMSGIAVLPQGWLRGVAAGQSPVTVEPRASLCQLMALAKQLQVPLRCVCLSESEVAAQPESIAALRAGAGVLAITRGASGADVYCGERQLEVGVAPVRVVDTTGAGDAFAGALVTGLAGGVELERALGLAAAAAGLTTERRGAHALDAARLARLADAVSVRWRPD